MTNTLTEGHDLPAVGGRGSAHVDDLAPHQKNRDIYADRDNNDLVERIEEHGFKDSQRLLVCPDGTILSGHRRWDAASQAGIDEVPVEVADVKPDSDEALLELLTANDYREKTPAEKINEAEMWEELEWEKAEERKKEATGHEQKFAEAETGQSRDKAAEKVGVSGETLRKGKKVKEKAEEGDSDAQREWGKLETGDQSIHGAYTTVTQDDEAEDDEVDKPDGDGSDIGQFTSQETDEWSSPREIVEPLADAVGGFDLDPCSGAEESPFAAETYTETDDGLSRPWYGEVWVNPPYSSVSDWVDKATTSDADCVAFLCKGDSSTDWWQRAAQHSAAICAIDHRLSFGDGENSAPFASHIFIFGSVNSELVDALASFGTVLTVGWNDE